MLKKLFAIVAFAFLLGACDEPQTATTPPPPPPVKNYLVFFDFNKSTLTPRALDIVKEAASTAKAGGNARITCTGHTDTAGPANYNMALSLRRAASVKTALVKQGVPATSSPWSGAARPHCSAPPRTACASRRTVASRS
jgi:OOP family OmpA-OmpF porin